MSDERDTPGELELAAAALGPAIVRRPDGMPVGRPFRAGSPPGPGRPKSFAAKVREAVGENGEELIEHALRIMRDEKQPVKERQRARDFLAERGWGKAPATLDVTVGNPDGTPLGYVEPPATSLSHFTESELARLGELFESAHRRELGAPVISLVQPPADAATEGGVL